MGSCSTGYACCAVPVTDQSSPGYNGADNTGYGALNGMGGACVTCDKTSDGVCHDSNGNDHYCYLMYYNQEPCVGTGSEQGNCGSNYACLTTSTGKATSGSILEIAKLNASGACFPTTGTTGETGTGTSVTSDSTSAGAVGQAGNCSAEGVFCVGGSKNSVGTCCAGDNLFCLESNGVTPATYGEIGTCMQPTCIGTGLQQGNCSSGYTCAYNPDSDTVPTNISTDLNFIAPNDVYGTCIVNSDFKGNPSTSASENGSTCFSGASLNSNKSSDEGNCGTGYACLTTSTGTATSGSTLEIAEIGVKGACVSTAGTKGETGTGTSTSVTSDSTSAGAVGQAGNCSAQSAACVGGSQNSVGTCCAGDNLFCLESNGATPATYAEIGTCQEKTCIGTSSQQGNCLSGYTCAYNPASHTVPTNTSTDLNSIAPNNVYGVCIINSSFKESSSTSASENGSTCSSGASLNSNNSSDEGNCGIGYACLTTSTGTETSGSTLEVASSTQFGVCVSTAGTTGENGTGASTSVTSDSASAGAVGQAGDCGVPSAFCVGVSQGTLGTCCASENTNCFESNGLAASYGEIGNCLMYMQVTTTSVTSNSTTIQLTNKLSVVVTVSYITAIPHDESNQPGSNNSTTQYVTINPGALHSITPYSGDGNPIVDFTAPGYIFVSLGIKIGSACTIAVE